MPYAPDLAGSALDGRYELHALIGEGTFGRVYRGRDRRLQRPVAIKVIKPWWSEDPDWAECFEREAQLLARVSDPRIVQIFDVGQTDQGLYYVAELVEGESLADRLRRGRMPSPRRCVSLPSSAAPWRTCMPVRSSTATSSPPTCSWDPADRPSLVTSASPASLPRAAKGRPRSRARRST